MFWIQYYLVCGIVMNGYISNYIDIEAEIKSIIVCKIGKICNALYPEALYVIQGLVECAVSLLVLFFLKSIHFYVKSWEEK